MDPPKGEGSAGPRAKLILTDLSHKLKVRKTIKLMSMEATVGGDLELASGKSMVPELKWQLDAPIGRMADVRLTSTGFTLSKAWDADLGVASCNLEIRGHCSWNGVVRPFPCEVEPTVSMDVVPLHTVTRAMTGGVAFAVGKTLDVNPRVQLGKLPVKLEVGASVYKEGADTDAASEVLVLRINSINALMNL